MIDPANEVLPSCSPDAEFAWVYNRHWGPYATQAMQILDELLLSEIPDRAHVLDLCCGTGQLAHLLCERGYKTTGLDSSSDMIRFACLNAPDADLIVQDARYFHFAPVFDAVISTYDSLNFIIEPGELERVFKNVFSCLKKDGWFVFDMNTATGYLDHWEGGTFDIVEEDHACIIRTSYEHYEQPSFDITIFRLVEQWRRIDLTLHQHYYSDLEISNYLAAAGFSYIRTFGYEDQNGLGEMSDESERMYFVCQKAGSTSG